MPYTYTPRARIRLERLKRSKILKRYMEEQYYVRICSIRAEPHEMHRYEPEDLFHAFWLPNAAGYTSKGSEAGIYSGEAAMKAAGHCGPEKQIVFEVLRQRDERTQDEMGKPRVEFKGVGDRTLTGKMRFKYNVAISLPPPSVGKSLEFDLFLVWDCHGSTIEYEIGEMDPAKDTAQLVRWHRAIAYAMDNLPEPRTQIPMW